MNKIMELYDKNKDPIFYYKECNRCYKESKYISSFYFKIVELGKEKCKYCGSVPDDCLESFKKSIYTRKCPICNERRTYKNRISFLAAIRLNKPCKACGHIPSYEKRKMIERKRWEPIIGYWNLKYKTLRMIKEHWNRLDQIERRKILSKTKQQKRYYWEHLRRKNQTEGHRKCRITMKKKYSGNNHWMKRPEVLAKLKKSCEKYCGDGHWFRKIR